MGKTLYLVNSGRVQRKENTLCIENKNGKFYFPIENIEQINVLAEIDINTKLLEFLAKKGIIINFFDYYGNYYGTFSPKEQLIAGEVIIKQVEHYLDKEKRIFLARQFIKGAVKNLFINLKYYKINISLDEYLNKIENGKEIFELMSYEGNFRKQYYDLLDEHILKEPFKIITRTRQPPTNYMNALISFGNSLLYATTIKEIFYTQLHPSISFLHEPFYRRYSLALDISEIFKPIIVDRIIFKLINKKMIDESFFEKSLNGILLNEKGRKLFISEYESKLKSTIFHKKLKRNVSYKQLIRIECYKLIKHLIGMETYDPFVMWW